MWHAGSVTSQRALRAPELIAAAQATSDGAGVRLSRSLGTPAIGFLDPFLMLDEFRSDDPDDYIAGFPSHPHRGFETVTYVLAGSVRHEDSKGNTGNLVAGSVQWMTAGRGIIHSEMPQQEAGLLWGFQLWVNLPSKLKMSEPRYQDIPPAAIPEVEREGGVCVRVIAGRVDGVDGAVQGIVVEPTYLDVRVPPNAVTQFEVPSEHNAFLYVYDGVVRVPDREGEEHEVPAHHIAPLGDGDVVELRAGDVGTRLLLVAGRPIGEPVAWLGPFVMNTRQEILQAVRDYEAGELA